MEEIEKKEIKEGTISKDGVKFFDNAEEKKRMAVFQMVTPGDGKVEWINVKVFGNQADKVKDLDKFDKVSIEGNLKTENYTSKEGVKKEATVLIANKIDIMEKIPKISLEGNIGKDGIKFFEGNENKKNMAVFQVADNKDNKTEWHNIKVFGKDVESVRDLKSGDKVSLEGILKTEKYTSKEGVEKEAKIFVASSVNLLFKKVEQAVKSELSGGLKDTKKESIQTNDDTKETKKKGIKM